MRVVILTIALVVGTDAQGSTLLDISPVGPDVVDVSGFFPATDVVVSGDAFDFRATSAVGLNFTGGDYVLFNVTGPGTFFFAWADLTEPFTALSIYDGPLPDGIYQVTAVLCFPGGGPGEFGGDGCFGVPETRTFNVIREPFGVSGFSLREAAPSNALVPNGLSCAGTPTWCPLDPATEYTIVAETFGAPKSVELTLSGPLVVASQKENVAPYSLFGDSSGQFTGNLFPPGTYTVTAQAFENRNLNGDASALKSLTFAVGC